MLEKMNDLTNYLMQYNEKTLIHPKDNGYVH